MQGKITRKPMTVRGYYFLLDVTEDGEVTVLDSQRGNAIVAKQRLPQEQREGKEFTKATQIMGRAVINNYENQHRERNYGIEYLPGIKLSEYELRQGYGKPTRDVESYVAAANERYNAKAARRKARR